MANINSSGPLGNVMTRLGGLKSVSGRRVMPGAEYLQDLEDVNTDVSGTAKKLPNFANFQSPSQNLPESDLGGELTPQSYDVRANAVTPPEEEKGFLYNLGQSLKKAFTPSLSPEFANQFPDVAAKMNAKNATAATGDYMHANYQPPAPPVEEIAPIPEAQPEYQRTQAPQASPGFFGAIKDYFSPTKNAEMEVYNKDLLTDAQLRAQGKNPGEVRAQTHENLNNEVQKAMEQPWQYSAYGSAQEVANSPSLQAEFKNITGIDYEPQIAAQVAEHEAAMKGVEDAFNGEQTQLSERAEGIKQRILDNQPTDADKYYIGLALLMPLLIGGFFGKEAALGALGGGAKGIADVLGGRQKSIREDEASLLDINKQQASNQEKLGNMALEKAKLGPALRKALPEQPEAHLLGMRDVEWEDPNTGQTERGVEIKPGLIARPQFVASKEGVTDMRKAANELTGVKTFVKEIDDLTEDVSKIVTQLKDPSNVWKGFTSILKDKVPGVLSTMTEDVMFDGRMQNAGTLLEEKLGFLANAYGMAKEIGQLDRAAQAHIRKIIDNPTSSLLTPRDALNQVLEVRKLAQKGLVESASNQGFYPEFIIKDLESRNNDLFGGLNKQENDKRLAARKKQALQSETQYAQ